ncbi:sulfotransferase 16, CORONATINE INDUCED-7, SULFOTRANSFERASE 16, ARABIDOPSIS SULFOTRANSFERASE 5A [Hibiscus trionum]|uniref:Sulfotransferase n=1 Tax=Hibiscus trionum TaxID=183268 RepID=A0A9W7HFW4_HIBTR|nr:sulfotransferase 16, CORONATINE INDUCED-7, SULFOTRANSFERASE 16, ARABIDOPSIS SULFOTRANSFERASE 5A [Hibiscus trionum]
MAAFLPISHTDNEQKCSNLMEKTSERYKETLPKLPKAKGWMTQHLVHYQGVWLTPKAALKGLMLIQDHFSPRPTDILLATFPKSGTTWLKALIFSTVNRSRYSFSGHPLLTTGPHDCFPFLDAYVYENDRCFHHLDRLPPPRLLSTHIPFTLLPTSMSCRFVYICRDPKDVLVSKWLFMNKLRPKQLPPISLEEAFELFCQGISHYGPYWDHVLGYWKASLENPEKILFLKYEDLKKEPCAVVKRLGEFTGHPFSLEEERRGVVQEIVKLCSFENLSNLEVNKTSVQKFSRDIVVDNRHFFRKGEVGDGKNYLTAEMMERLNAITAEKLHDSGLVFGY